MGQQPDDTVSYRAGHWRRESDPGVLAVGKGSIPVLAELGSPTSNGQHSALSYLQPTTGAQIYAVETSRRVQSGVSQRPIGSLVRPFEESDPDVVLDVSRLFVSIGRAVVDSLKIPRTSESVHPQATGTPSPQMTSPEAGVMVAGRSPSPKDCVDVVATKTARAPPMVLLHTLGLSLAASPALTGFWKSYWGHPS